jgi:hypothetical protein
VLLPAVVDRLESAQSRHVCSGWWPVAPRSSSSLSSTDSTARRPASSWCPLQPRELRNRRRTVGNQACACAVTSVQVMGVGRIPCAGECGWCIPLPSPLRLMRSVLQTRQGCVSNHDDTKFTSNSACPAGNNRSLPAPVKNERQSWPGQVYRMPASGVRTTADRCATIREGCTQQ